MLTRAAGWARRMPQPPSWWADFAAHLATQRHPFYAADVIADTARLLLTTTAISPSDLLTRARQDSPQLVGALTDFFRAHGRLIPPDDPADAKAAVRRERRIEATPAPLRPEVWGFAYSLLAQRDQARQLGLRPNQLKTIEIRLDTVRDLGIHLHARGHTSWASVSTAHLEAFLAKNPARRASWLAGLRQFFSYAHRTRAVLRDPTGSVTAAQHRDFTDPL
ncbi:hypothetical protein ACHBTE_34955 [Streptomyces sp. M41]|uniref:hypothetical protein n=1 Tax=Streptomyces sp. M41 TaxID=3059412 RepID=UPI00374CC844